MAAFVHKSNWSSHANDATHYAKLGKKRTESPKRNYYIIIPREKIKAIIIIFSNRTWRKSRQIQAYLQDGNTMDWWFIFKRKHPNPKGFVSKGKICTWDWGGKKIHSNKKWSLTFSRNYQLGRSIDVAFSTPWEIVYYLCWKLDLLRHCVIKHLKSFLS